MHSMSIQENRTVMGSKINMVKSPLLAFTESPAVEIVNTNGTSSAVLVCDHASNRVPAQLGTLGIDSFQLMGHIGWDPGAANVARSLSVYLDAPLVLSGYSRLVIDCNRPLYSEDSIAEQSASVQVPGNCGLLPIEKELRVDALFQPYHQAISQLLDSRINQSSMLLSIHSFTPVLNGQHRPWHIGVSSGHDRGLADLMIRTLSHNGRFNIGDNEPYQIDDNIDYTIPFHGEGRGLPCVMFEIRQDEISSEASASEWALRLAEAYQLIENEALNSFA